MSVVDTATQAARTIAEKPRRARRPGLVRSATAVAVLVGIVILWQIGTMAAGQRFFPTPLEIIENTPGVLFQTGAGNDAAPFFADVLPSLARMAAGFLGGTVAGVLLGAFLGWFGPARDYAAPITEFLRSVPATAVLPIFIMLLGIGSNMQILFISWGVMWFVLINTTAAVAEIHPTVLDMTKTFRIPKAKVLLRIVLPAASPKIFAGMRIGLTAAMILFVTSEFMGATNGIGYQLIVTQSRFQVLDMWSWMLVIAVAGFLANTILEAIEARVLRWHTASRRK